MRPSNFFSRFLRRSWPCVADHPHRSTGHTMTVKSLKDLIQPMLIAITFERWIGADPRRGKQIRRASPAGFYVVALKTPFYAAEKREAKVFAANAIEVHDVRNHRAADRKFVGKSVFYTASDWHQETRVILIII